MLTSDATPSYTTESSNSSNDSEVSSSFLPDNSTQYGPIQVRLCRKTVPTLETGRRSKHLVLVGDEALRREKRRERNRAAAKKIKEKRQSIEDELNEKLKHLESEHSDLQNYLQELHLRKQNLQDEVNNLSIDSTFENFDRPLLFEQYPNDMDLFDEAIETILNFDLNTNFNPVTHN